MNSKQAIETKAQKNTGGNGMDGKKEASYRAVPFTITRRTVAASASTGREQNNIQAMIEVDISTPRQMLHDHYLQTGEKLSLTAYVIACLARAVADFPHFNSFQKGNRLILLNDVTISVQVEREINGEIVPDPIGIQAAQAKTYRQIYEEIRASQEHTEECLGDQMGMNWIRFIPGWLLRTFFRLASKNIRMMQRYGAIGVTAVGMFCKKNQATWFVPLSAATVAVTVGGIVERPCLRNGRLESSEHLCLTVSFNHDIVDGAPAARFLKQFSQLLMDGTLLTNEISDPNGKDAK